MLERDRRLVRERHQQLLLVRRKVVHVSAEDTDRTDHPLAAAQRDREHRAKPALALELGKPHPRVRPGVAALHRPSRLHGEPGDPLAVVEPDRRCHLRRDVEARHQDQVVRERIDGRDAAGVDAEDGARLLQDDADRAADIEARGHGAARFQKRLRLARPAPALVGEAPALDRRGQRARDLRDRLEVGVVERGGARRRERDRAEHGAPGRQWDERHRAIAAGGEGGATPGRPWVAPEVVDAHGHAVGDDASEQRAVQGQARVAPRDRRRGATQDVDDLELRALGVEQRDPDGVEGHQLRGAVDERREHFIERVARRQARDQPAQHGRAERATLEAPDPVDGLPELSRHGPRQRDRSRPARPTEEHQFTDAAPWRAERHPEQRRGPSARPTRRHDANTPPAARRRGGKRHQPPPERRGRASGATGHDNGRLAPRAEGQRAGRRAAQAHHAPERLGEPLLHGRGGGDRRQEVGSHSPEPHAVTPASAAARGGSPCGRRP